jgi:dTDP-4-dehydrorhamnose 3,5-epimerase
MIRLVTTRIPDVLIIEPQVLRDDRGFFLESWHAERFRAAGLDVTFVQDNHSRSARYTLRGLHYQSVEPQGKLIRVTAGEAFDVAVDLRRSSPSFGRWVGVTLSEANLRMLWIPPGFAHGFLALSDKTDLLYKCTTVYRPEHDRTLSWDEPSIGVAWPLPPGVAPLLSVKDRGGFLLADAPAFD